MRLRIKNSFRGYESKSVLQAVSELNTKHQDSKKRLSDERKRLVAENQELMKQIQPHQSINSYMNKTYHLSHPTTEQAAREQLAFKTVFFGLHKKKVKQYIRKLTQLQEYELTDMTNEIERLRHEYNQLSMKFQSQELYAADFKKQQIDRLEQELKLRLEAELRMELESELSGKDKLSDTIKVDTNTIKSNVIPFNSKIVHADETQRQHDDALNDKAKYLPHAKLTKAVGIGFWDGIDNYLIEESVDIGKEWTLAANETTATSDYSILTEPIERVGGLPAFFDDTDSYYDSGSNMNSISKDKRNPSKPKQVLANELQIAKMVDQQATQDQPELKQVPEEIKDSPLEIQKNAITDHDNSTSHLSEHISIPQNKHEVQNTIPVRKSPAISDEIKSLRIKYIVGKLAGEDLFDHSGRIIIEKNKVITEDIIDKADREGKLAELIVHMIIPGLGV